MIHFWDLPQKRTYVKLNSKFHKKLIGRFFEKTKTFYGASKLMGYSRSAIKPLKSKRVKINIDLLIKISNYIGEKKFDSLEIEKNIIWIGQKLSTGIENPNLPFDFSSREGSRFVAAIFNDGCLVKGGKRSHGRLMYDNFDKELRESVKGDIVKVTGIDSLSFTETITEKKKYIAFPSILRDVLMNMIEPGSKPENNQHVPEFIFNSNDNMKGWLEQTIADEGNINFFPQKYRRSIVWRRSIDITKDLIIKIDKPISIRKLPKKIQIIVQRKKPKLIDDEMKMLNSLGVSFSVYNLGIYPTEKGRIRTRWQINIEGRKNLVKLRSLLEIPHSEKDKKFTMMIKGFVKYKESLNIRKNIIRIQKRNGVVTSRDLQKSMNYKNIGIASRWLKRLEKEEFLKCIKKSIYSKNYREPAQYIIQGK